jgi:peptidoglycan/LPS O-acetylase OafA/YrhL
MDTTGHSSRRFRERLQVLAHYLTAFALALKGVSKLDHPHGYWPLILLCWISATMIVILTARHDRLEKRGVPVVLLTYLAEAAVCGALAFVTFQEGKHGLPYAWLLVAVLYGVAAVVRFARLRRGAEPARAQ